MDVKFFNQFRQSLLHTRENLISWLTNAPQAKKQVRLGDDGETPVHEHIEVIDTAIDKANTQTLGVCKVCHGYVEPELLEMDYTADVCLDHYSEEERRHLEYELELAQSVQRTLLPQLVPDIPGLEVAAFSRPAQIVGGDYFDFLQFKHGAYGVVIADVAGHGMAASLHMASVQTLLRTLVPANDSPAEVVQQVHHLFKHNIRFTTFVSLFLAAYDPESRSLIYCNAGHNHPLVLRKGEGQPDSSLWLDPTGPAIGLVEDFQYTANQVNLKPGDILVIYTDGITEAFNLRREMFGKDRLESLVRQGARLPARDLISSVRGEVEKFIQGCPLEDDTTLLVLKVSS